ncbi:MAG: DUF2309 domain-containing protein [Magnetococcales bacterium]|nr:DUF2309 domain-containing protein [Magnetococcales bacterium]
MHPTPTNDSISIQEHLRRAIAHMEHRLTAQAPLKDFVHHNTLHAYQEHPFPQALALASEEINRVPYLPPERFRDLYRRGRITQADLLQAIDENPNLDGQALLATIAGHPLQRRDVLLAGLLQNISPLPPLQLPWHIEEHEALHRFQSDLPPELKKKIIRDSGLPNESAAVADLWRQCLEKLSLQHQSIHPEELLDLSADQAQAIIDDFAHKEASRSEGEFRVRIQVRQEADTLLEDMVQRLGRQWTLRRFLLALTGQDILEPIQPLLIRHLTNYMDLGVSAWTSGMEQEGFYPFWRQSARRDLGWILNEMPDWDEQLAELPDNSLDAIMAAMLTLGLTEDLWPDYLERLCQEIPGWSGMFAWRQNHPHYSGSTARFDLADYLAVRLVLEHLFARRLCLKQWKVAPNLFFLRWHFNNNKSELLVRHALFNLEMPDHFVHRAQVLVHATPPPTIEEWRAVAHLMWTWRHSQPTGQKVIHTVHHSGWRLFRLAQHLGLGGHGIRQLSSEQAEEMLASLDRLTPLVSGFLWLQAYEWRYRDQVFNAILQNHGRGKWAQREQRPAAQMVFCMDDREEGIRRHLEERNPDIETFGAAGFFGVAINWKGLDDTFESALCPIVDRPAHKIQEVAAPSAAKTKAGHDQGREQLSRWKDLLHNATRHGLWRNLGILALSAPVLLIALGVKQWRPHDYGRLIQKITNHLVPPVETVLTLSAPEDGTTATPEHNRLGFTDVEQAERVGRFLRNIGLTSGFAPLVVMMGHGSSSKNNPHRAAYDCGACSGRHGGPNARVFAAMANRTEVRTLLAQEGIVIPEDTWFIGANHNTGNEAIVWFDRPLVPATTLPILERSIADLDFASRMSAQERCRKVASAPPDPDPDTALHHFRNRCQDISQARPELGHATNAIAFVGRRSLSRGVFLDRRAFLISYDPETDPSGEILQRILLNVTPVGGGINLEYYFSTVMNEHLGCGSKVTHNLTGFFGIMDGTESDLRTGLPLQMIEIHEAMRLQIIVEAETSVLTTIYHRQPLLQEWVGNGWVLLSAKNPHNAEIHVFKPDQGWIPWHNNQGALPVVERSPLWYRGHRDHLGPALIQSQQSEVLHG